MATDQQVVLTRPHRMPAPSSHISKAARQVVPAFLQKLYEMVNDPNNAELIRWSEAGDSFFVLDHERFAHEVLGRWFKHRNFSSFVRQLNMYGFHKIPHLQQGVLKSDTDTEFWNFAHAHFHRGQPDMLCLIQRKKQIPQAGDEGVLDLRDGNASVSILGSSSTPVAPGSTGNNTSAGNATLSSGQILDIQSILNGISVIKRHQTTISTELDELKRSNQMLWQDALAARAKHQKQQDTINRIVKFLAGVFGNHAGGTGAGGVSVTGASPGVSGGQHGKEDGGEAIGPGPGMRKMRLMIEDAKRDGPKKSMIEELSEIPLDMDTTYDYPTIETPLSAPSPSPSIAMSDNVSNTDSPYFNNIGSGSSNADPTSLKTDNAVFSTTSKTGPIEQQPQPPTAQEQQQGNQISRAVTPSRHSPNMFEFDPRGVLNQLSPQQIQQLLASLAAQTLTDPAVSSTTHNGTINPSATTTTGGPLTTYQPSAFDFLNAQTQSTQQPYNNNMQLPIISPEGLISFDQYDPLSPSGGGEDGHNDISDLMQSSSTTDLSPDKQHEDNMDKQWHAAEDIDKDVNALNSSINSLIQTFGLDPRLLEESLNMGHGHEDAMGGQQQQMGEAGGVNDANSLPSNNNTAADFDFDTFFNNLSSNAGDGSGLGSLNGMDYGSSGLGVDVGDLASSPNFMGEDTSPTSPTASTSGMSDMTASPVQPLRQVSPGVNLGSDEANANKHSTAPNRTAGVGNVGGKSTTSGRKRKSDVIIDYEGAGGVGSDAPSTTTTKSGAATRSKRKKEK